MIETEPPRRVALYARYSTDMQNPLSIRDQFAICRDFVAKKGWVVVKEYHDEQLTSASPFRDGYQALLSDLDQDSFDIVVAEAMDRLTRDPEDSAQLYQRANFAGVILHMLAEGEMDLLKIGIAGIQGSHFLQGITQRTRRGLIGKIKDGKSAGGRSYGYRPKPLFKANGERDGSDLDIVPEQALVIRRIFREFADGKSPIQIAGALNEAGIAAPRGRGEGSGHWKQNTINGNRKRGTGILNNELYIGRRVWNRQSYTRHPITRKRVARPVPESEWLCHEVPHLRIIDDELWEAVKTRQDALSAKRARITPTKGDKRGASVSQALRRRKYLLSGLLTCSQCGGNLTVAGKGERRRYYCANAKEKGRSVCEGMPGVKEIEAAGAILGCLEHGLLQDEAYAHFAAQVDRKLRAGLTGAANALQLHDKKIRELEKRHAGYLDAVANGQYSPAVIEALNKVDAELKELRARREDLVPAPIELPPDLPEMYRQYVRNLTKTLTEEDVAGAAGDELHRLIDRVFVRWDEDHGVHELEVEGDLVEMLKRSKPDQGPGFEYHERSLKLVAGVGFGQEPTHQELRIFI